MKTYKQIVEEVNTLNEAEVKLPKTNMKNLKVLAKGWPWFYQDRPEEWKRFEADRKDIKKAMDMLKKAKTEADFEKLMKFTYSLDTMVGEKIATAFALDLGADFVADYLGWDLRGDPVLGDKNWKG